MYFKKRVAHLPCLVGIDQDDGSRSSDGSDGCLSYGPALALEAGRYFGGFHVRSASPLRSGTALKVDVVCRHGARIVASQDIPDADILTGIAGLVGIPFELDEPEDDVEVRLWITGPDAVNARDLLIFSWDR